MRLTTVTQESTQISVHTAQSRVAIVTAFRPILSCQKVVGFSRGWLGATTRGSLTKRSLALLLSILSSPTIRASSFEAEGNSVIARNVVV